MGASRPAPGKWEPFQDRFSDSEAADEGSALAMWGLGRAYELGEGVQDNRAEAVLWYERAADLGEQRATSALQRLGVN